MGKMNQYFFGITDVQFSLPASASGATILLDTFSLRRPNPVFLLSVLVSCVQKTSAQVFRWYNSGRITFDNIVPAFPETSSPTVQSDLVVPFNPSEKYFQFDGGVAISNPNAITVNLEVFDAITLNDEIYVDVTFCFGVS